MKVNSASINMLRLAGEYVTFGPPNLKTVRELVYKRGFASVNKQRLPITDNKVIIAQHLLRPCLLIIPRRSGRRLRPHAPLRPSTWQVLKSINYSPAALQPILEAGIDKENQAQ